MLTNISKFAYETKLGEKVQTLLEFQQIQLNLNKIVGWSEKWRIILNDDKCEVMQKGHQNHKHE